TFPAGEGAHSFYSFGLSPDGKTLAWGDAPAKVKVWPIGSDKAPVTLDGHTAQVTYAAFSADGKWLATGSPKELILWDAKKLQEVKKLETPANWLAFEPGGKTLLTAGRNHVVTRWDLATYKGTALPSLNGPAGHALYHLSPDGKTLYSLVADLGG